MPKGRALAGFLIKMRTKDFGAFFGRAESIPFGPAENADCERGRGQMLWSEDIGLIERLVNAGLAPENAALMMRYFDSQTDGDDRFVNSFSRQDPRSFDGDRLCALDAELVGLLMRKETAKRAVRAFCAIFGGWFTGWVIPAMPLRMQDAVYRMLGGLDPSSFLDARSEHLLRASSIMGMSRLYTSYAEKSFYEIDRLNDLSDIEGTPSRFFTSCLWIIKSGRDRDGGSMKQVVGCAVKSFACLIPQLFGEKSVDERVALARQVVSGDCDFDVEEGYRPGFPVGLAGALCLAAHRRSGSCGLEAAFRLCFEYEPNVLLACFPFFSKAELINGEIDELYETEAFKRHIRELFDGLSQRNYRMFLMDYPHIVKRAIDDGVVAVDAKNADFVRLECEKGLAFNRMQKPGLLRDLDGPGGESGGKSGDPAQSGAPVGPERACLHTLEKNLCLEARLNVSEVIESACRRLDSGARTLILDYISGDGGLEPLLPIRHRVKAGMTGFNTGRIGEYGKKYGPDPFYARACVVARYFNPYYMMASIIGEVAVTEADTLKLLDNAARSGCPEMLCVDLLERAHSCLSSNYVKRIVERRADQWLDARPAEKIGLPPKDCTGFTRLRTAEYLARHGMFAGLSEMVDLYEDVREPAARLFAARPEEGEKEALRLLRDPDGKKRRLAASLFEAMDGEDPCLLERNRQAVERALKAECEKKARDDLAALCRRIAARVDSEAAPRDLAKLILSYGGGDSVLWALKAAGADGGRDESREILAALMLCCREKGALPAAERLAGAIKAEQLAEYADRVLEVWLSGGAPYKRRWVLLFACVFGGDRSLDTVKERTLSWPLCARGALACAAVDALALSRDPSGLMFVYDISRKSRFRQLRRVARDTVGRIAERRGMTVDELADGILPDFGFDERGVRRFEIAGRVYEAALTDGLEVEITDGAGRAVSIAEDGADGGALQDACAPLHGFVKRVRGFADMQKRRFEEMIESGKTKRFDRLCRLLGGNIFARVLAKGLVWGVYRDGNPDELLLYREGVGFVDMLGSAAALGDDARVGLVHPVELEGNTAGMLLKAFERQGVTQPVAQLARKVVRVSEDEKKEYASKVFGGRVVRTASLGPALRKRGWFIGEVLDGGCYYDMYKTDGESKLGARLEFEGMTADAADVETVVRNVVFFDASEFSEKTDYTVEAVEETVMFLGDVPKRFFSEVMNDVEQATCGYLTVDEEWEKIEYFTPVFVRYENGVKIEKPRRLQRTV